MYFDREELVSHVEPAKRVIMRNVVDKLEIALYSGTPQTTDFLDPYEVYLAVSILNRFDEINYSISGGIEGAERSIIYIYPAAVEEFESKIRIFKLDVPEKIDHRDILGSVLGLGIDRKKVGDIVILNSCAYIFVKDEIGDFIYTSLRKIGKHTVKLSEVRADEVSMPPAEYERRRCILSSLRLDAFISDVLNISRGKAKALVRSERVKVNFRQEVRPGYLLEENDLVSVRGFGRFIFASSLGTTKKSKFIVEVLIPK